MCSIDVVKFHETVAILAKTLTFLFQTGVSVSVFLPVLAASQCSPELENWFEKPRFLGF